jgi:hypothetical protein
MLDTVPDQTYNLLRLRIKVSQNYAIAIICLIFFPVGIDVDHDATREARSPSLQAHALPALRRRGAAAGLRRQRPGRRAARGHPDRDGGGGGRSDQGLRTLLLS